MEVLDAARMRRADERTIKGLGVPGLVLMENAGRLVAETLLDEVPGAASRRVVVLAGRGNNGGDGFVAARHLAQAGLAVEVLLVGSRRDQLEGDADAMARAWTADERTLTEVPDLDAWRAAARPRAGDIVVDALFGTGLARPLAGFLARVVDEVRASGAFIVAVDIPSGLFASDPGLPGPAIHADLTVTFARPKPAHLLPPAEDLCGDVVVVDIGIPDHVVRSIGTDLHWVTSGDAAMLLPEREDDDHKGCFGHVLVVAGSVGKAGAAALTAWGALRSGAGLCTAASPAPVRGEVAAFAPELMTEPLPATREGGLARGAAARALELAGRSTVLALGPGLGEAPPAPAEIRRIVAGCPVPVVLDADGLNAFAGKAGTLAKRKAPLVITPHPGEAARLAGCSTSEIQADRVGWARRLAAETGAICVLKGHRTIVAAPDGVAFINSTGNPGMASGGMGDALTGIIAGLIAQQLEPLDAAVLGVYLHGLAADIAVSAGGDESEETLTATAVLDSLSRAFRALEDADDEPASGE